MGCEKGGAVRPRAASVQLWRVRDIAPWLWACPQPASLGLQTAARQLVVTLTAEPDATTAAADWRDGSDHHPRVRVGRSHSRSACLKRRPHRWRCQTARPLTGRGTLVFSPLPTSYRYIDYLARRLKISGNPCSLSVVHPRSPPVRLSGSLLMPAVCLGNSTASSRTSGPYQRWASQNLDADGRPVWPQEPRHRRTKTHLGRAQRAAVGTEWCRQEEGNPSLSPA